MCIRDSLKQLNAFYVSLGAELRERPRPPAVSPGRHLTRRRHLDLLRIAGYTCR